jgi:oxygen-independent coproporphyrinogen III oxidase
VKPAHLYVHVPFCARRCAYCDFAVTALRNPPADAWLDAIAAELESVVVREGWSRPLALRTLYVGGGTPSLLPPDAMARLRERIAPWAGLMDGAEWTVEGNPESLTLETARGWAQAGVNRVSLGAQTFHAASLAWMGRMHGPDGPAAAIAACREAGLENVSIDLIFGLPTRLGRDWAHDLERVLELQPVHVSLYGLTAESATPLGGWIRSGRERMPEEDDYEAEYLLAAERLGAAGFEHYEVSNFARPQRQSLHNAAYWTGVPYLGLGPGAHSFLPPRRFWNTRDWEAYRHRVTATGSGRDDEEIVEGEAAALEAYWLSLRTRHGVALSCLQPRQREQVQGWIGQGWAEQVGDRVQLNARGWLLLDRLAVELDHAGAGA